MDTRRSKTRAVLKSAIAVTILLGTVLACAQSTDKEESKSGRLNFVKTLKYGNVGTHGSQGWYVSDRNFYVNGKHWSPPDIKVADIAGCKASPNTSVEALKCYSFADSKEAVFVLRMKDDTPEWITVSDAPYGSGDNLGEWVGDGKWLLFRDYYFNVSTSERKPVKGLPDDPGKYFRAASPDLKTVIYEEYCFTTRLDLPQDAKRDAEIEKQCHQSNDHIAKGIIAFWLIDTETGNVKLLELKKETYPSLDRSKTGTESGFNGTFVKMLVWKQDHSGKDQLVYPTSG
ncbi:MAG TPA: hypothetical protein VK557_05680 [Pyrinomonadaceae bacterium]|nr:hypothetical protein [Pyrinomonadaceae bacterium]